MPEHNRLCPKCDCSSYSMIMNDYQELIALECNMCGERLNIYRRILSLNEASYIADLMRAVQRKAKLDYYPNGADCAPGSDSALMVRSNLRALTDHGGGFWPNTKDMRDAYIWTSGTFEHWYSVRDLLRALSNIDGHLGLSEPMAMIRWED